MKIEPYDFKIPLKPINPRDSVLEEIREQHPWHWDPMKMDHGDALNYEGNVEFDWEGLAEFAIKKANEHMSPEKFWWYDKEADRVMHSNDDVSNAPIIEQARLALVNNFHTKDNTQYFKIANEEFEDWYEPLQNLFPGFGRDKMGISLFIQPPGHNIWSHVDTFSSFIRRTGDDKPDYSKLRRYMIFVRDWDWGHFFHWGNQCINQWRAGDFWDLQPGVYHGSANAGINPKITIHWSGEIE